MMERPSELSLEEMRIFLLNSDGKATNHALVNHFKAFLTDPLTKDASRAKFKEYVNRIATVKHEKDVKYLLLKKRYQQSVDNAEFLVTKQIEQKSTPPPYKPPPNVKYGNSPPEVPPRRRSTDKFKEDNFVCGLEAMRQISDAVVAFEDSNKNKMENKLQSNISDQEVSIKAKSEIKPNQFEDNIKMIDKMTADEFCDVNVIHRSDLNVNLSSRDSDTNIVDDDVSVDDKENKQPIDESQLSVKERMQRFNNMAAVTETDAKTVGGKKKCDRIGTGEEDDTASLTSLDQKGKDVWHIRAAQCDYHELAKLAAENSHLPRIKDPATGYTALHWAAKHGDQNVAKLIAGTYGANVNAKTNGGYTPLHIAAQFGKDDFFDLLVKVYGADPNIRDWSGKKPHQYHNTAASSVSQDTFHKIKARKKHLVDKEAGFLRIGSLNVRVKRTTDSITQFLGVNGRPSRNMQHHGYSTSTSCMKSDYSNNNFYKAGIKSWGSADNIPQEHSSMPPPKSNSIHKRKSKTNSQDSSGNIRLANSTPSTPNRTQRNKIVSMPADDIVPKNDSDSDTACGFDEKFMKGTRM